MRAEKVSGTSRDGRNELATLLTFLRPGDIGKVDRLARSVGDLQDIAKALRAQGVAVKVTDQPIDTSTAAGKSFLDMLAVFAEFETSLRRERQMEGMAKAKVAGVYRGRKATISADEIKQLKREGIGASTIAPRMGTGRASATGCWTPMLAWRGDLVCFPRAEQPRRATIELISSEAVGSTTSQWARNALTSHLVQGTGERRHEGRHERSDSSSTRTRCSSCSTATSTTRSTRAKPIR